MTHPSAALLSLIAIGALGACEGPAGPPGPGGNTIDAGDPPDAGGPAQVTGAGLIVEVTDASITAGGVASALITITDAEGVPLDRDGLDTEGAVSLSFVIAHLAVDAMGDPAQYTAYTTRVQTSPDSLTSATQAASESNGTWEELGVGRGTYRYTFTTDVEVADAGETHTVGVYGSRSFAGTSYGDDDTFDFVPDGGVAVAREVVTDAACNSCHSELSAHGGARKSVELCVMCHTGQTTDPDTGNSVDMRVMIHKIHGAHELPSVVAGTPYQIVGYQQSVHDYSTVAFPQPINQCDTCHQGAQADNWKNKPGAAACTSCHDDITFSDTTPLPDGMAYHPGGLASTAPCATCHGAETSIEPIVQHHAVSKYDPAFTPELTILSITSTGPGQFPVVTLSATVGGAPRDLIASPLTSLRATFAGPNTDYAGYWQLTILPAALVAVDAPNGVFSWTSPTAIPVLATGSYTLGLEGSLTPADTTDRIAAVNPLLDFAVTDPVSVPRRQVVALEQCDGCHKKVEAHGGSRTNPQYCAMCHNPNNTNDERAPHVEGQSVLVHTVSLPTMIHRIHRGEDLTQPYVLGGHPVPSIDNPIGQPIDFGHTRYPAPKSQCSMCHDGDTFVLPLAPGHLPAFDEIRTCSELASFDGDTYCDPANFGQTRKISMGPASAACLGCHDAVDTVAHTTIMTSSTGSESCAVCHGPDDDWDVKTVHGL